LWLFYISPSLGGIESLVLHLAARAYSNCSPDEPYQAGIPDNLVRLALGVENTEDLIADLGPGAACPVDRQTGFLLTTLFR
jgi:cystathionine beta-lyase/cystathionine gamma-synthase